MRGYLLPMRRWDSMEFPISSCATFFKRRRAFKDTVARNDLVISLRLETLDS